MTPTITSVPIIDFTRLRDIIRQDTDHFVSLVVSNSEESLDEITAIAHTNNELAQLLTEEDLLLRVLESLRGSDVSALKFALTDVFYRGLISGMALSRPSESVN